MHTVTAVIMASLPVRPTKKVSAMLYITSIIWPITAGMARESMASAIGASSKRCFSLLRPFMLLSFPEFLYISLPLGNIYDMLLNTKIKL